MQGGFLRSQRARYRRMYVTAALRDNGVQNFMVRTLMEKAAEDMHSEPSQYLQKSRCGGVQYGARF
eukprot:1197321-Amphidinium_carterae.1